MWTGRFRGQTADPQELLVLDIALSPLEKPLEGLGGLCWEFAKRMQPKDKHRKQVESEKDNPPVGRLLPDG